MLRFEIFAVDQIRISFPSFYLFLKTTEYYVLSYSSWSNKILSGNLRRILSGRYYVLQRNLYIRKFLMGSLQIGG